MVFGRYAGDGGWRFAVSGVMRLEGGMIEYDLGVIVMRQYHLANQYYCERDGRPSPMDYAYGWLGST